MERTIASEPESALLGIIVRLPELRPEVSGVGALSAIATFYRSESKNPLVAGGMPSLCGLLLSGKPRQLACLVLEP